MAYKDFDRYLDFHRALAATPGLKVLLGVELDFYQGCYVSQDEFLKANSFDLVLGTVRYQSFWSRVKSEKTLFDKQEIGILWRRYFKLIGLLVECGLYDVVSVFDLPKQKGGIPGESLLRESAQPLLDKIAQYGIALEVNTSGLRDPIEELYPSPQILAWAFERGIPICFGSGAEEPGHVGHGFADAVRLARQAGYNQCVRFEQRRKSTIQLG
jgi:histidinol-phosphatase (PHP family)